MDRQFPIPVAQATDKPVSEIRQRLRSLREAGLVPGFGKRPSAAHIARVILSFGSDTFGAAADAVTRLRQLTLATPTSLPSTVEGMLTRLVETIEKSPVFGDFDVDGGSIAIGENTVVLDALTLDGHRACVRYGAAFAGIAARTTIPIDTIKKIAIAVKRTT